MSLQITTAAASTLQKRALKWTMLRLLLVLLLIVMMLLLSLPCRHSIWRSKATNGSINSSKFVSFNYFHILNAKSFQKLQKRKSIKRGTNKKEGFRVLKSSKWSGHKRLKMVWLAGMTERKSPQQIDGTPQDKKRRKMMSPQKGARKDQLKVKHVRVKDKQNPMLAQRKRGQWAFNWVLSKVIEQLALEMRRSSLLLALRCFD